MSCSSSTPPAEGGRAAARDRVASRRLRHPGSLVPWILVGIWCGLILFGLVSILNPPWLRTLSHTGAEAEALSYSGQGDQKVRDGDYRGALWWYQRALKADPDNAIASVNSAICFGQLGRFDEGLRLLQDVLDRDARQRGVILYNVAELYRKKGDRAQAIANYEAALAAGGRPELIDSRLGDVYAEQGDIPKAHDAFEEALRVWKDPVTHYRNMLVSARESATSNSEQLRIVQAAIDRGITESDLSRFDCDLIREQMERDPEVARLLGRLGAIEAQLGDPASHSSLPKNPDLR
jgi:tetratricopeptide (TPR) repeat protein